MVIAQVTCSYGLRRMHSNINFEKAIQDKTPGDPIVFEVHSDGSGIRDATVVLGAVGKTAEEVVNIRQDATVDLQRIWDRSILKRHRRPQREASLLYERCSDFYNGHHIVPQTDLICPNSCANCHDRVPCSHIVAGPQVYKRARVATSLQAAHEGLHESSQSNLL